MGKTSGRRMFWLSLVAAGVVVVAAAVACGGEEVVVERTVIVEKPVVQTVVVEKPVEKVVQQTVVVEKVVQQTVVVEKVVQQTVVVEKLIEKVVVATPTPAPAVVKPTQTGTLIVALTKVEPPIFLPSESAYASSVFNSFSGVFEGLVRRTYAEPPALGQESGEGIATSWTVASDQSKITFKIRSGVMFHKGFGELTADDVAYSFNDSLKEGSKFGRAGELKRYMDRWEAIDKNTVVVYLKPGQFDSAWWIGQDNTAGNFVSIVSKKFFDQKGATAALTSMVATGPYEAVTWAGGKELVAEAIPAHWRATGKIKVLRYVEIPEPSTQRAAFATGEVHIIQPPLKFIQDTTKSVRGAYAIPLDRGTGQSVIFSGNYWAKIWPENNQTIFPRKGFKPDAEHPWIGDPNNAAQMESARKVRWALAMAIDRDLVNLVALKGLGTPLYTNSGFRPGDPSWKESWFIPYDVVKAKQFLKEAGFPECFTFKFQIAPDLPTLITPEVGQAAAQMWQQIGCKVQIEQVAYAARRATLVDRSMDIPWLMQSSSFSLLHEDKYGSMIPSAGFNYGIELPNDVAQPWYDNRTIAEDGKRVENNAKVQDWLSNAGLFSPIVQRTLLWTVRPEVIDWRPHYGLSFNSPETVVMR